MQFSNSFDVSLPPDQAWAFLLDVESIVPCMPGAELLEKTDERHFKGKISVRLGPVALAFVCDAAFETVDDVNHEATVVSKGADTKGRGGAGATIRFKLSPKASGTTVAIDTDLAMTGAVAQYGRGAGMMQSVANQIILQFSRNLETRIAQLKQAGAMPDAAAPSAPAQTAPPRVAAGLDDALAAVAQAAQAAAQAAQTAAQAASSASQAAQAALAAAGHLTGRPVRPGVAPAQQAKPISGFSLMAATLRSTVSGWFGK